MFPSLLYFSLAVLLVASYSYSSENSCPALEDEKWTYVPGAENGPSNWKNTYPMCSGNEQSPVNIDIRKTERNRNLGPLQINNYQPVTQSMIRNNGHTVVITPTDDNVRTLTLEGTDYTLRQFHFHWGNRSNLGSEHTINKKAYSMEGHFVHESDDNKLAVIGVIYQLSILRNNAFVPLVNELSGVPYKGDELNSSSTIDIRKLLPNNLKGYYRYEGSLTTPPCSEGVTWTVMQAFSSIGKSQISQFRELYAVEEDDAEPGCHLVNNFRPVQDLNGRTIYASK